jgi:CMP-N,N'-diacetyllegionaminic acid synthase
LQKPLSIVALIPARSGSKRIQGKNIKILKGHPLIAYTICAAKQSGIFEEVIVSTDSAQYANIAKHYGADVYMRPLKYAGDNSPDIEWVTYTLNSLVEKGEKFELFSILRPTSPFRMPVSIKKALNQFSNDKRSESIRAVEVCSQHPAKMWREKENLIEPILVGNNGSVPWHSCQFGSLPTIYVQNASLEISKVSNVFDKHSISGDKIMPFYTKGYEGFDLNQPFDWEFANYLLKNNLVQLPSITSICYKS